MRSLRATLQPFSAVVITGGSSGIGACFIQACQSLKPELTICNLSRRAPAKAAHGNRLVHFRCDLARPDDLERGAREVGDLLARTVPAGKILLINNSGFGAYGSFSDLPLARNLAMIDVNVRAAVHLTGLLLPLLRLRGGAIVTVASAAAFQPTPYCATYGATKTFILHWSVALNEELRGSGIHALAICPGPVATPFIPAAGLRMDAVPPSLLTTPPQVVAAALCALARGKSQVVVGWQNALVAWVSARVSKALAARLAGRILSRLPRQNGAP